MIIIENQQQTEAFLNDKEGIVIRQNDVILGKEINVVVTFAQIDAFIAAISNLREEAALIRSAEES